MPITKRAGIVIRLSAEGAETVKRALRDLGKDGEEALRRLERVGKDVPRSLSAVDNMVRVLKGTVGALLAGFTFDRVMRTVGAFVNEASGLVKAADRIGVTTERLQELHHAARLADIEVSELDRAMQFFGKTLGEAMMGRGELVRVLEANNVALFDEHGRIRATNDLLEDYADLIKNARSEQERLTLAQIAFGPGGIELVTMLAGGAAGLRENAEEARRLGLVIRDDLLRNAEALEDDWTRLTSSMTTAFKSFVLSVVSGVKLTIEDLGRLRSFIDETLRPLDRWVGELVGVYPSREGQNFATGPTPSTTGELMSALGLDPDAGAKPTTLPTADDRRGGANSAVERILRTVEALKHQAAQLDRSAESQAVYNALLQAGIDENHAMAPEVMSAAAALYEKQAAATSAAEALAEANRALDEMRDLAGGALKGFIGDLIRGKSAAEALGDVLANIGNQLLNWGINGLMSSLFPPLAAVGGPMSILPPLFGPGRAGGGDVMPGRLYPVGERGVELFAPHVSGAIVPNHAIGGGKTVVQVINNGGGEVREERWTAGDTEMVRIIVGSQIAAYDRMLPDRVAHISANPRERF